MKIDVWGRKGGRMNVLRLLAPCWKLGMDRKFSESSSPNQLAKRAFATQR